MRKLLAIMMRYFIGLVLLALSVVAFIVMLAYYQESVAIWPATAACICFVLGAICFTER